MHQKLYSNKKIWQQDPWWSHWRQNNAYFAENDAYLNLTWISVLFLKGQADEELKSPY